MEYNGQRVQGSRFNQEEPPVTIIVSVDPVTGERLFDEGSFFAPYWSARQQASRRLGRILGR